jgi:NADH dehydrogenase
VLVLGGTGFLGRHVVAAIAARGHCVTIGSRTKAHAAIVLGGAFRVRRTRFERLAAAHAWHPLLVDVDVVVNCVGILREGHAATYDNVHHRAPAALALACAASNVRLVHVSALGLDACARSGFIQSKRRGEAALRASGADCTIVRPSLLDGDGGFGARWLRWLARLPVHCVPADATGRIAALDVGDAASAIARLAERSSDSWREVELGGLEWRPLAEYLAALRGAGPPAFVVRIPALLARVVSHICDALHCSPFSFGHLELLRRDNVPNPNALPALLGHAPRRIGAQGWPRSSVCARSRQPSAERSPRWWKYTERASAVNRRVDSAASNTASGTPRS